jgi:hypothetical protein
MRGREAMDSERILTQRKTVDVFNAESAVTLAPEAVV